MGGRGRAYDATVKREREKRKGGKGRMATQYSPPPTKKEKKLKSWCRHCIQPHPDRHYRTFTNNHFMFAVGDVRLKWHAVRSQFMRALRSKGKSGSGASGGKWKFFAALNFLQPTVKKASGRLTSTVITQCINANKRIQYYASAPIGRT